MAEEEPKKIVEPEPEQQQPPAHVPAPEPKQDVSPPPPPKDVAAVLEEETVKVDEAKDLVVVESKFIYLFIKLRFGISPLLAEYAPVLAFGLVYPFG